MSELQKIKSGDLRELLNPSMESDQLGTSIEKSLSQFVGKSDLFDFASYYNVGLENGKLLEDESVYVKVIDQRFEALNNYYESHNLLLERKLKSIENFKKKFIYEKEKLTYALNREDPESFLSKNLDRIENSRRTLSEIEKEFASIKSDKSGFLLRITIFSMLFALINFGIIEVLRISLRSILGNSFSTGSLVFAIAFSLGISSSIYFWLTTNTKVQRSISLIAILSILISVLSLSLSNSMFIQIFNPSQATEESIDLAYVLFLTLSPIGLSSIAGLLLYFVFSNIKEYSYLSGKSSSLRREILDKKSEIQELNSQIDKLRINLEEVETNINTVDSSLFKTEKLKLPSTSFIQNLKASSVNSYLAGYNKGKALFISDKVINISKHTFDNIKRKEIDYLNTTENRKLTVEVLDNTSVDELQSFLFDLDNAYKKLYVLYSINNIYEAYSTESGNQFEISEKKEYSSFLSFLPIAEELLIKKSDELTISKISISSPGIVEVLGKLNPLEQIRVYLKDRHERKKDKKFRNEIQKQKLELENDKLEKENEIMLERMQLENQKLKDEMLMKRIEFIKSLEISEEKKTELIENYFITPLLKLGTYQERKFIKMAVIPDSDTQVK